MEIHTSFWFFQSHCVLKYCLWGHFTNLHLKIVCCNHQLLALGFLRSDWRTNKRTLWFWIIWLPFNFWIILIRLLISWSIVLSNILTLKTMETLISIIEILIWSCIWFWILIRFTTSFTKLGLSLIAIWLLIWIFEVSLFTVRLLLFSVSPNTRWLSLIVVSIFLPTLKRLLLILVYRIGFWVVLVSLHF